MLLGMQSVDWQQKPNARERIMFFAAMGVFLFGFFKTLWFPSHASIDELRDELEKLTQEQKVAAQLLSSGPTLVSPKLAPLSGAGTIKDVQAAVQRISQPLLLKGVILTSMKASELEREGNMVREKMELQLSGNFYSIAEYLEALEALPAPLVIEDFAITLNDDKSGKVVATIKGSFYGMDK